MYSLSIKSTKSTLKLFYQLTQKLQGDKSHNGLFLLEVTFQQVEDILHSTYLKIYKVYYYSKNISNLPTNLIHYSFLQSLKILYSMFRLIPQNCIQLDCKVGNTNTPLVFPKYLYKKCGRLCCNYRILFIIIPHYLHYIFRIRYYLKFLITRSVSQNTLLIPKSLLT